MTQLDREYAAGETGTSSKDNVEILVVDDNHDLLSMLKPWDRSLRVKVPHRFVN